MLKHWLTKVPLINRIFNGRQAAEGLHAQSGPALIELRQVVKCYETEAGDFTALKGVNLRAERGEFVSVVGKSGSGKSTLLNMITGIDRPTSGEVLVAGTAVHQLREGQIAVWRGKAVGVVFQFFQLLPTLTVIENIMLPMDFCNIYSFGEREKEAMRLLKLVDLADQARKLPTALSGGQQQRVAIARALANDPPILVADEPTGNLDSATANSVVQLFAELVAKGKTILMVTHDSDLARRATRTVTIADGEVIDEHLLKAFPTLSEQQLLQTSRKLEPLRFPPGGMIIHEGAIADRFYIITKGEVNIIKQQPNGRGTIINRLRSGQYFGEMGLIHNDKRIATVQATPEEAVEVVTLGREAFCELIGASEVAQAEITAEIERRRG
jgi:ABC-type lipoprotein export system ATPase subunit